MSSESIAGMSKFPWWLETKKRIKKWAMRAENVWNENPIVAWALLLLGASSAIYFYASPQLPGVCIGILGLVAGIMSVRGKMGICEKMAWVALLVAFAVFEVQAIKRSDAENTAKNKDLLEKNQEALDRMTGGESYLLLQPSPSKSPDGDELSLQALDIGKYTLWDVLVEWEENEPIPPGDFLKNYSPQRVILGSVSSTYISSLPGVILRPSRDRENRYTFRVFSRNMPTIEQLFIKFDRTSNQWEYSYWISRYLPGGQIGVVDIMHKEHLRFVAPLIVPFGGPPARR